MSDGTNGYRHDEGDYPSGDELNGGIDDGNDAILDAALDLIELNRDDFPRHFRQRGNRLFHSHGTCTLSLLFRLLNLSQVTCLGRYPLTGMSKRQVITIAYWFILRLTGST